MRENSRCVKLAKTSIVLLSLCAPVVANATDVYLDRPSFLAQFHSDYYEESFDSLGAFTDLGPSVSFSNKGFMYEASAPNGLFGVVVNGSDNALSTNATEDALTLNFTNGNISAVGGEFFNTSFNGGPSLESVTVNLSDGTSVTVTGDANNPMPFRGFVSTNALITSLTMKGPEDLAHFPTVNNLIVGSTVPEPGLSCMLLGLGMVSSVLILRRTKK